MNTLSGFKEKTGKYMWAAEKFIFPFLLLIFPLLLINQGIDVTDTTYSLSYYRFMDEMDLTWVLATYVANVTGAFLMKLPLGHTLLGMNLYTGLIASLIALICYYFLKRYMSVWVVFLGEIIALSLCWCPTTTLYNYLTYLLFLLGSLFLYHAIISNKKVYYVAAGVCLGLNVMVRFSNLAEAALIIALWFSGWLYKDKLFDVVKKTGLCLAGYLAGFGSILLIIMVKYGVSSFGKMVSSLFGMTEEASDYTLFGMISDIASAYAAGFKWMIYMIPCALAGMIMFYYKKGKYEKIKKLLYGIGILILLRFYLGQGMFSLRYYNEGSIFQWMMLFLILSVLSCIASIGGYTKGDKEERIFAMIVLIIIIITPLGSNNYTYQNMNNLFLAAPFTLWICYKAWLKTRKFVIFFPWQAFAATIIVMTLIQGVGFGCTYVFRDGIHGEKRDARVDNSQILNGMYTTRENADSLTELIAFCDNNGVTESPILIWGDAPGLSYILDVPSAIFTTWPEIPSNTYAALDQALEELDWEPTVILHHETGQSIVAGEKSDLILDYIAEHTYACVFKNNNYTIYQAAK